LGGNLKIHFALPPLPLAHHSSMGIPEVAKATKHTWSQQKTEQWI